MPVPMHRLPLYGVLAVAALGTAAALADTSSQSVRYDAPVRHEIAFASHAEVEVAEQDFFILRELGPGAHLSAGLALNWHSDGKTYGVLPGEFAKTARIKLFAGLPPRAGL